MTRPGWYANTDDALPPESSGFTPSAPRSAAQRSGARLALAIALAIVVLFAVGLVGPLGVLVVGFSCLTVYVIALAAIHLTRAVW